jgi:hypothetical protein
MTMTSDEMEELDVKPLHLLRHGGEKQHSTIVRTSTQIILLVLRCSSSEYLYNRFRMRWLGYTNSSEFYVNKTAVNNIVHPSAGLYYTPFLLHLYIEQLKMTQILKNLLWTNWLPYTHCVKTYKSKLKKIFSSWLMFSFIIKSSF